MVCRLASPCGRGLTSFVDASNNSSDMDIHTIRITWRHQSRDHWIHNMRCPIDGQFESTVYLAQLSSVTCPLDSQCMVSYRWSFETNQIYLAWLLRHFVSNIYPSKFPLKCIDPHFCFSGKIGVVAFFNVELLLIAAPQKRCVSH